MTRRLAAILVADVVGYARLMERDETGTLAALRQRRKAVLEPVVRSLGGRIVKFMGDGVLIEFASAVDAVKAAMELQAGFAAANEAISDDRQIILRIGINVGDVIGEGSDIYGEGVNVAARLEGLSEPGGICMSDMVYRQVKNKIDRQFTDLGERQLKNITEPLRVYGLSVARSAVSAAVAKPPRHQARRTSIAVLPFDNMSGDAEQTYFSDGITEDIITELSKFKALQIIARNSSFQFRGKAVDIRDVASKLDVQFVVEGSVRKMGNRIRVSAQLIDTESASHVWAERYDRDLVDVFAIQDEISRAITVRVAGASQSALAQRVRTRPTTSLTAYDCYLRGRELFINYDTGLQSLPFLERAVELDPNFAIGHAMLADTYCFQHGYDGKPEHLDRAMSSAQKALALDAQEPWANFAMALVLVRLGRLFECGHHLQRAVALNPNDVYIMASHASWLARVGRHEEALTAIEEALRRDPYAYDWFWDERAIILATSGRYQEAVDSFHRMKTKAGIPARSHCYQIICHTELDNTEEIRLALEECRNTGEGVNPQEVFAQEAFADPGVAKQLMTVLLKGIARVDSERP